MSFLDFFKNHLETRENAFKKSISTHYFVNNYAQTKAALIEYANAYNYTIKNVNDTYHEMFIEKPKHHIIFTVIEINPRLTAVEMKVAYKAMIGMNRPLKVIEQTYAFLKTKLKFKGIGLNR